MQALIESLNLAETIRVDIVDFYCFTFGQIPGVVGSLSQADLSTKEYLAAAASQPITEISVMLVEQFRNLAGEHEEVPPYTASIWADQVLNPSVFDYGGDLRPDEQNAAFTPSAPVSKDSIHYLCKS